MPYNFVTHSFHIKKLCVADFLQAKCDFRGKTAVLRFEHPLECLEATYDAFILGLWKVRTMANTLSHWQPMKLPLDRHDITPLNEQGIVQHFVQPDNARDAEHMLGPRCSVTSLL